MSQDACSMSLGCCSRSFCAYIVPIAFSGCGSRNVSWALVVQLRDIVVAYEERRLGQSDDA